MIYQIEGGEGEDRGQMGSTRMEEQKLMAELAAVQIKMERTYRKKEASRTMSQVNFLNALLPSWFASIFPGIHTDMNKADLSDKTAPQYEEV